MAYQLQTDEGISCAVCLEPFKDPRVLRCQHSYCLDCLQGIVQKTIFDPDDPLGDDVIVCPRCRQRTSLGGNNVAGLPCNFDLKAAVEALKPMMAPSPAGKGPASQSRMCSTHLKPLEYYCKLADCSKPICGDCHVQSHQRHDVCKLEDAVTEGMASLRSNVLDKADIALSNLDLGIMEVERMIEVLGAKRDKMTERIHERFQRILDAFQARERQLVEHTERVVGEKIKNLKEQLNTLQQAKKGLSLHLDTLKSTIATPEAVLFLGERRSITDNVNIAVLKAQSTQRRPCESEEEGPHYHIPESIEQMAQEVGGIYCMPVQSKFTAQGESLKKAFVGKESHFTVWAYDQFGQRSYVKGMSLMVEIKGPDGLLPATITEEGSSISPIGQYVVNYVPNSVGMHTVSISVDGIPISSPVFKVMVFKCRDYYCMDKPVNIITKSKLDANIASIRGMAVTAEDQVVFADAYYIRILDTMYSLQVTYGGYGDGRGQVNLPLAVVATKNKPYFIYISDSSNHRIHKISLTGNLQIMFGEQGTQPGQFNIPEGIAVLNNTRIYIADHGNHRIQVFRQNNHKLMHVFGKFGTMVGELNSPRDIAIDLPLNRLLVADWGNSRIQAFTLEGVVLPQPGFKENVIELQYPPCRIACDPDSFILVSHMKAFVSVLTPQGEVIRYLGIKNGEVLRCLQCSYGICVNSKGEVLVSDGSNHSIVVF